MPIPQLSWANLSIRLKCTIVVFLPILALTVASGFGYWSLATERQAEQFASATATVRASLSTLREALIAAEAERQDYLLKGDAPDQVHLQQSLIEAQRTVAGIQAMEAGGPDQQTELTALSNGISGLLSLAFNGNTAWSPDCINDQLTLIQIIDSQESQLLGQRLSALRRSQIVSEILILGALVLGLTTAMMAAMLLSRSITRRVSDLLEGIGVIGHGMTVVSTDDSQDELGKLGSGLARTSRLLSERQEEIREMTARLRKRNEDLQAEARRALELNVAKDAFLNQLQTEVVVPLRELERHLSCLSSPEPHNSHFELAKNCRSLAERISGAVTEVRHGAALAAP
jgi:methyl-accepting chemotaxis protein